MTPFPRPRWYRDTYGKLWIDGQFYMGRMRVPSMPPRIGLVDRETGEFKILSHNGTEVELADRTPTMSDVHDYGMYDGPHSGDYKLYLSGGELAFEYDPGYNSAKILTRRNFETNVLEITADEAGEVVVTAYAL